MGESRKQWTGEEILAVLKRHLVDKVDLSKVCEECGAHPSQFYRWQAMLFSEGAAVFERKSAGEKREVARVEERAAVLEKKLQRKNEVMAELMEEHVRLKKSLGEI
jgi:transposase